MSASDAPAQHIPITHTRALKRVSPTADIPARRFGRTNVSNVHDATINPVSRVFTGAAAVTAKQQHGHTCSRHHA